MPYGRIVGDALEIGMLLERWKLTRTYDLYRVL